MNNFVSLNFIQRMMPHLDVEEAPTSLLEMGKSGIKIKKKNRGKFTEYCGGKVTDECIQRGKNSSDPKIRKRATFAKNARAWKHQYGGSLQLIALDQMPFDLSKYFVSYNALDSNSYYDKINKLRTNLNGDIDRSPLSGGSSISSTLTETSNVELNPVIDLMSKVSGYSQSNYSPSTTNHDETYSGHYNSTVPLSLSASTNLNGMSRALYWSNYKKNNQTEILNNALHIYNRLREAGYSKSGAQAILAHLNHESAGTFNTRVLNFGGGNDTGIALWVGGRKTKFKNKYNKDIIDATLDEQIDYLLSEISPQLRNQLIKEGDLKELVKAFLPFESGYFNDEDFYKTYHHTKNDAVNTRYGNYVKSALLKNLKL